MIIDGTAFPGGQHCETTTLGALLHHEGLALSEALLFGLGEGLGFICWDAKSLDFPLLGGRTKPLTIARTVAGHLGLTLTIAETTSRTKAWRTVDTAGPVTTPLAALEEARSARGPMTARNLSFTIAGPHASPDLTTALRKAIASNARTFLDPPIANLGHRGIAKASKQVLTWGDRPGEAALAGTLMEHGGTGGGLFRVLYRDFLAESATIVDDDALRRGHARYAAIAPLWTEVAAHLVAAGSKDLRRASEILAVLADEERDAMRILATVGSPRQ